MRYKTFGELRVGDEVYVIADNSVEIVTVQSAEIEGQTMFARMGDTEYSYRLTLHQHQTTMTRWATSTATLTKQYGGCRMNARMRGTTTEAHTVHWTIYWKSKIKRKQNNDTGRIIRQDSEPYGVGRIS